MQKRIILAIVLSLLPASAMAETYRYKINALGMPIGAAKVDVTTGDGYKIAVDGNFTGIAAIFVGATGTVNVSGQLATGKPAPSRAEGNVAWGEKPRHTLITYDTAGNPGTVLVEPPYNYNPKKRVPLDTKTLVNIVDPLSAMLRPVTGGKPDCTTPARVFDGHERYDLQFSPTADPQTCHVQPVNISGYDRKYDREGNQPRPLTIHYLTIDNGTLAIPSRIERELAIGSLDITLDK